MVTTLATFFLLASSRPADRVVTLTASDDVWVYPHASDPGTDPFLRVWGTDGRSVSADSEHGEFSYGYVRFDLANVLKGKLKEVHLIMTHAPAPAWTLETVTANPLEVRPLKGDFDEKTWSYEKMDKCSPDPDKDAAIGTGSPDKLPEEGKFAKFDVDLMKGGKFAALFETALGLPQPHLSFALCSKVDPATLGRTSVYKFYSKDNTDKDVRPTLKLVFED